MQNVKMFSVAFIFGAHLLIYIYIVFNINKVYTELFVF